MANKYPDLNGVAKALLGPKSNLPFRNIAPEFKATPGYWDPNVVPETGFIPLGPALSLAGRPQSQNIENRIGQPMPAPVAYEPDKNKVRELLRAGVSVPSWSFGGGPDEVEKIAAFAHSLGLVSDAHWLRQGSIGKQGVLDRAIAAAYDDLKNGRRR